MENNNDFDPEYGELMGIGIVIIIFLAFYFIFKF